MQRCLKLEVIGELTAEHMQSVRIAKVRGSLDANAKITSQQVGSVSKEAVAGTGILEDFSYVVLGCETAVHAATVQRELTKSLRNGNLDQTIADITIG